MLSGLRTLWSAVECLIYGSVHVFFLLDEFSEKACRPRTRGKSRGISTYMGVGQNPIANSVNLIRKFKRLGGMDPG